MAGSTSSTLRLSGIGKRKMNALKERAREAGVTPQEYVLRLLDNDLRIAHEARSKTFAQILGPGQPFDEDELDALVETARNEHHRTNKRG